MQMQIRFFCWKIPGILLFAGMLEGAHAQSASPGYLVILDPEEQTLQVLRFSETDRTLQMVEKIRLEGIPAGVSLCGNPDLSPDGEFLAVGWQKGTDPCSFAVYSLTERSWFFLREGEGATFSPSGMDLLVWKGDSLWKYFRDLDTGNRWVESASRSIRPYRVMAGTWTFTGNPVIAVFRPPLRENNPPAIWELLPDRLDRMYEVSLEPLRTGAIAFVDEKTLVLSAKWVRTTTQPTEGESPAISLLIIDGFGTEFPVFRTAWENIGSEEELERSPDGRFLAYITWAPWGIRIASFQPGGIRSQVWEVERNKVVRLVGWVDTWGDKY